MSEEEQEGGGGEGGTSVPHVVGERSNGEECGAPEDALSVPEDSPLVLRSGAACDQGSRFSMEDTHLIAEQLEESEPTALYGVFDGHSGTGAAHYVKDHLANRILSHADFPEKATDAMRDACLSIDENFKEECATSGRKDSSGTTALACLVTGKDLMIANIGDSRAVLCRRGKAIALSQDQKPSLYSEWERIQKSGGFVDSDGFLNGMLGVSRAIGNWNEPGMKVNEDSSPGPLIADPDITSHALTDEDEFLVLATDGFWDVFSSDGAITFARQRLGAHNDPAECSAELVAEAIQRSTRDNTTVVVVCFTEAPPPKLSSIFAPKRGRSQLGRTLSANAVQDLKQALCDTAE